MQAKSTSSWDLTPCWLKGTNLIKAMYWEIPITTLVGVCVNFVPWHIYFNKQVLTTEYVFLFVDKLKESVRAAKLIRLPQSH